MKYYLDLLTGIQWIALAWILFIHWVAEWRGRPAWMVCSCRMFPAQRHHLDTPWLLVSSIATGAVAVTMLAIVAFEGLDWIALVFSIVYVTWSSVYYKRWKKHKKGGKNGSLAKLLARVKVTAGGLRVVPVKGDA